MHVQQLHRNFLDPSFLRFLDVSSQFWDEHAAACDKIVRVAIIRQLAFLDPLPQRGPVSTPELFSSLLRMTEGEKSSGEPWNRCLSYWFYWKVCLVLLSAGAVYYKYARKEKLFGAILVINFNGIKGHLTNAKPMTCRSLLVEPLAHSFFFLRNDSFNNWLLLFCQFETAVFTSFSQSEI